MVLRMLGLNFGLAPAALGPAPARNSLVEPSKPPTGLARCAGWSAVVVVVVVVVGPREGVRLMELATEGARVEPTPTEATRLTEARR